MARKKQAGTGAVCSVLLKYLHPAKYIDEKYPNRTARQRLLNCLAINQQYWSVKKKQQLCIVLCHDDHPNKELIAVKQWVKVEVEGAPEHYFRDDNKEQADNENKEEQATIEESLFHFGN